MKNNYAFLIFFICCYTIGLTQNIEVSFFHRIDTMVIYDPETKIEQTKIISYETVNLTTDNCNELPKKFKAKPINTALAQIKKLSQLELRCNGKTQVDWNKDDWKISSFNVVIYKANQAPKTIANQGNDLSKFTKEALETMKKGELISFEQIILDNPAKGSSIGEFSLRVD